MIKLLFGIFIFFLVTYLVFELVFGLGGTLELYIRGLPASFSAALIIISVLIADILIPVPSSIVMSASGALFGGLLGGVIALIGALLGSAINFQISRRLGQARIKKRLGGRQYQRLSEIMQRYGVLAIILTRMVPLIMESTGAIAGISNMQFKKFLLANIVGFSPLVFLYSYAGAIYKNDPSFNIFIVIIAGFFIPLIIWLFFLKIEKFFLA